MEVNHITAYDQKFVSILDFGTYGNAIYCWPIPEIWLSGPQNTPDVFVKSCNRNNYNESISYVANICRTDFKWELRS